MKRIMAGLLGLIFGATTVSAGEDYAAKQAAYLEANLKKPGWHATASGLQYLKLNNGPADAKQATLSSVVKVHYEGKLITGEVFDSSFARKEPIEFPLAQLIRGWQEGIPMMRTGEIWQFVIPSDLGYGPRGAPPDIPGGAALLFRIQLLDVQG